ncbi:hypothetical protein [Natrinema halophilum]|uniref:Uncharacterized protein n=1 Tax=Natrinema halophilum TaxID=1699371 RepID=A0A7D5KBA2_9EURY|nr:hypothetical protein [Natrinema halophilum]QLG47656.1 hypothetical protein HYG82_01745 [Natrinema halophilum]
MANKGGKVTAQRIQNHRWYDPTTAFLLGVLFVFFLALLGGAIGQSAELVDVSGTIVLSIKMSAIGLGTGYYLGSSIKDLTSDTSWFLFGAFSTYTVISVRSTEMVLFDQYPAYILLVCGVFLTTLAHLTPLVTENEEYMTILTSFCGQVSVGVVAFIAVARYLLTAVFVGWHWYLGQSQMGKGFILVLLVGVSASCYGLIVSLREQRREREVEKKAKELITEWAIEEERKEMNGENKKRRKKALQKAARRYEFENDQGY